MNGQGIDGAASDVHHVLWTGGWDSTFRVLHLVLTHGRTVQPHSLVDPDRPSAPIEITTMQRIATACNSRARQGAILPLRMMGVRDLAPDPAITAQWQTLRQWDRLGPQYEWLARYARQHDLDGLELGVDTLLPLEAAGLQHCMVPRVFGGLPGFALADDRPQSLALFDRFRFPLYFNRKADLSARAEAEGFADLMAITWFCHTPLFGRLPCGHCYPCWLTWDLGLGRRIGPLGIVCMAPRFVLGDARAEALRTRVRAGHARLRAKARAGLARLRRAAGIGRPGPTGPA